MIRVAHDNSAMSSRIEGHNNERQEDMRTG